MIFWIAFLSHLTVALCCRSLRRSVTVQVWHERA
jgi:hypothetical protein